MPELPDVEVYKQYLDATSLHKKIKAAEFPEKSLLQSPAKDFEKALTGNKFKSSRRLGKYLFVESSDGSWLVLHFGMTGKLEYYQDQDAPEYAAMLIHFSDGAHLAFINKRKLGKVYLAESVDAFSQKKSLGKDALDFTEDEFVELLQNKGGSIKGALTDQNSIAGIGNVYADEILYHSGIHPKTNAKKLDQKERKSLFKKMRHVLELVIDKGADPNEVPRSYLLGHRKEGAECPKCSGKIEKIKISGRSTYFCPQCQEEK